MENTSRKKVLWVEDDKLLGQILSEAISGSGFDLKVALTGREAAEILQDFTPDIIMVDLYLPGDMNGYDILERVTKDPRFAKAPTIILSNFAPSEKFGKEHPVKPTKYLLKANVSIKQIIETLKEVSQ